MRVVQVPSYSVEGKVYNVRIFDNGKVVCDCPRYAFKKKHDPDCKHIREVVLKN